MTESEPAVVDGKLPAWAHNCYDKKQWKKTWWKIHDADCRWHEVIVHRHSSISRTPTFWRTTQTHDNNSQHASLSQRKRKNGRRRKNEGVWRKKRQRKGASTPPNGTVTTEVPPKETKKRSINTTEWDCNNRGTNNMWLRAHLDWHLHGLVVFGLRACLLHKGSGSYAHFCPRPWLSTCRWARQATHRHNGTTLSVQPALWCPFWPCTHRMCVIAKRLGSLHKLAHTAGRRYFSSARESQHHTNLPTCLAAKKKNAQKTTDQKGGPERPERPRAPQSEPKRPRAAPKRSRAVHRSQPETIFSRGTPWESQKTASPERGKRHISVWVWAADFFFVFQRCQRQAQSTPRQPHQRPAERPQRPQSGPRAAQSGTERRRAAQSGAERPRASQWRPRAPKSREWPKALNGSGVFSWLLRRSTPQKVDHLVRKKKKTQRTYRPETHAECLFAALTVLRKLVPLKTRFLVDFCEGQRQKHLPSWLLKKPPTGGGPQNSIFEIMPLGPPKEQGKPQEGPDTPWQAEAGSSLKHETKALTFSKILCTLDKALNP